MYDLKRESRSNDLRSGRAVVHVVKYELPKTVVYCEIAETALCFCVYGSTSTDDHNNIQTP